MESLNQPSPDERKALLQEQNGTLSLNPDVLSLSSPSEEILKELTIVLERLRFFEGHCVWWKTVGLAGTDEQAFLTLTINHLEKIVEMKRKITGVSIERFFENLD